MQSSSTGPLAEKPCHNCRRRRLKCDRSLPACVKCARAGQECLGYGKLFLWNQGVASRGKMMGKTFPTQCASQNTLSRRGLSRFHYAAPTYLAAPLLDPVFGDMEYTSRQYLFHFANTLSSDMVISSANNANPFCSLIPLAREHPILLHAVVANAALHLSCLHQRNSGTLDLESRHPPPQTQRLPSQRSIPTNDACTRAKIDAFAAKHKALILLRHALDTIYSTTSNSNSNSTPNTSINPDPNTDIELIMTAIHLFITFDLIDVDECEWKPHVQGAIRLISCLQSIEGTGDGIRERMASPLADMRDSIMSDCLTYYILGSTLLRTPSLQNPFILPERSGGSHFAGQASSIIESLTRAESNSYLSLPTPLLQILFQACELANRVSLGSRSRSTTVNCPEEEEQQEEEEKIEEEGEYQLMLATAQSLLNQLDAFDVVSWAESLECSSSPERRASRIHTALAHQAAVRIYIIRSVDGLQHLPSSPSFSDTSPPSLVHTIITHLTQVSVTNPLFKATCWPTFIAGAETDDPVYREWAVDRLRQFWELIPWGYIRTAVEVMRMSWAVRDNDSEFGRERGGSKRGIEGNVVRGKGWIQGLKALERDWLIA
ncbi:fungal-specific transcription factor domain-containing protein [Aspergillus carlsbadensis]|nr:fungal-specific transcription factor domain-containing protein [Aspergillus carlsbadensis]